MKKICTKCGRTKDEEEFALEKNKKGKLRRRSDCRDFSKPKKKPWHRLAGTMTDKKVAETAGITPVSVVLYRKKMGIPAYRSQRAA